MTFERKINVGTFGDPRGIDPALRLVSSIWRAPKMMKDIRDLAAVADRLDKRVANMTKSCQRPSRFRIGAVAAAAGIVAIVCLIAAVAIDGLFERALHVRATGRDEHQG